MMSQNNPNRWGAVAVFFVFMLLHQTDRLLIGPLTSSIMAEFQLNESQMGAVISGALLISSIFYPIWGLLYDRYARPKLLALASLAWGLTTWLSAIAPTAALFMFSRASTGIDDSSYSGMASLTSDYFPPRMRGRIFGFLQVTIPLGYLLGLSSALYFGPRIGWRKIYLVTGCLGVLLALVIYLVVQDVPRGSSEPELINLDAVQPEKFSFSKLSELVSIPSLRFIFLQGFLGVIPWQVITFWSFRYFEVERNYDPQQIMQAMTPAVLMISAGYFAGGFLGDIAFRYSKRGRMYISIAGVLTGSVLLALSLSVPIESRTRFQISLAATSFFIPIASPNIASTVYDVVLPEIRSTAMSIQYFLGNLGSAFAPLVAGLAAQAYSLREAILFTSVSAWLLTAILMGVSAYYLPQDMRRLSKKLTAQAAAVQSDSGKTDAPQS